MTTIRKQFFFPRSAPRLTGNRWKWACFATWLVFLSIGLTWATRSAFESLTKPEPVVVSPFDLPSLDRLVGQEVILQAEVLRAGQSKSGRTRYLNFALNPGESAALAFQAPKTGGKDPFSLTELKAYEGNLVRAVGTLTKLHGQHLLFIRSGKQLRMMGVPPGNHVAAR